MLVFGYDKKSRGCFHVFNNQSIFEGVHLIMPDGDTRWPVKEHTDPYFVTDVSFAQHEKLHLVQCFESFNYGYAFGFDPTVSNVTVTLLGYMITGSAAVNPLDPDITEAGGGGLGRELSFMFQKTLEDYNKARVSVDQRFARVVVGSNIAFKGLVVGMDSATQSQETNTQTIRITLKPLTPIGIGD